MTKADGLRRGPRVHNGCIIEYGTVSRALGVRGMDQHCKDYYAILGVSAGATPQEIRKAYRTKARSCHPDVNADDPGCEERFKDVAEAYEVLSDPARQAAYDRQRLARQRVTQPRVVVTRSHYRQPRYVSRYGPYGLSGRRDDPFSLVDELFRLMDEMHAEMEREMDRVRSHFFGW